MAGSGTEHKSVSAVARIGTRGSPLALWQARAVQARLEQAAHSQGMDIAFEIAIIKTTGDKVQDRPLSEIGGKGLFTKEIEDALLSGAIDLAVHSMKDVLTLLPPGLKIAAMLEREDPRDALISRAGASLETLPHSAALGTNSLRRQAQALALRRDLRVVGLRGNVETRLAKVKSGDVDATLLALAGLKRLGKEAAATAIVPVEIMLPAVGQGAIGIESRIDAGRLEPLLTAISHDKTEIAVLAERACLRELEGDCRTPIAAYAVIEPGRVWLRALLAASDGSATHRAEGRAILADAEQLGRDLGRRLKASAALPGKV